MREERKGLVPSNLAKEGFKFIFMGEAGACRGCKYRSVCVDGMEVGRLYVVKEVDERKRFQCPIHGELTLASITRANIEVALEAKMVEGASFVYRASCGEECEYRNYCKPEGVKEGDKLRVIREIGKISCKKFGELSVYEVAF
ncbi:MAG: UPF0179 family protein [Candidatus Korarchaeum sp.]|jgi:uncharacterized protein (UPF0179 family)|nr:UPF0179 family protein [Candidatus Korarchaeum sp.]